MEELIPLVAIVCIFVVLPGMAMLFADRARRRRDERSHSELGASADLVRLAERMEKRIEALEKILDAEAPGWRSRHHG